MLLNAIRKGNILDWMQVLELRKPGNKVNVRLVDNDDVSEQEYNLFPARYLDIEDAVSEGYKAIALKDLVSVHIGDKCDNNEGHFVNIGDLSSDGLYSTVEIANLPFGELRSNFKRIHLLYY